MGKKVCIIIPTKGRTEKIEKRLSSILRSKQSSAEIVVVDDGIDVVTSKGLDKFKDKIKVLKSNSRGPSYARNLAAKSTDAEFVAFTDSDCIVDKNWIKELLRGFEEFPEAVACGGAQKLPSDATNFEKKVFLFMKKAGFITDYMRRTKKQNITEVNHNASCNVMYKRDIFLKEGGFLEGLWPGEDVELDYRLKKKGYKLVFNPKAVVYHYRPKTLGCFLKMMYRYGLAQGFLVRKYGIFRKIHILPLLSIFFFFLFLLLVFRNDFFIFWIISGVNAFILFYFFDVVSFAFCYLGGILWHAGFISGLIKKTFLYVNKGS